MKSYNGIRALVTGHTGFKGSWLCSWLKREGAVVAGLALAPPDGSPSLFDEANVAEGMDSHIGDIRDFDTVSRVVEAFAPQIIFHLAAQPLVRHSYRAPIETFGSNVMGTLHVLEAARACASVKAIVCVTTDKVYESREWPWGYRETDALGGKDPYSASKACAELVAACYRQTMLPMAGDICLATARGGNVIGGGDWSEDRLIPDIMRALQAREPVILRNPGAVRPWQHVLELVHAYLHLGERLLAGDQQSAGNWNFGPGHENEVTVGELVSAVMDAWQDDAVPVSVEPSSLVETGYLRLDNSKARQQLGWAPVLGFAETIAMTARWYHARELGSPVATLVAEQIEAYRRQRAL